MNHLVVFASDKDEDQRCRHWHALCQPVSSYLCCAEVKLGSDSAKIKDTITCYSGRNDSVWEDVSENRSAMLSSCFMASLRSRHESRETLTGLTCRFLLMDTSKVKLSACCQWCKKEEGFSKICKRYLLLTVNTSKLAQAAVNSQFPILLFIH